MARTIHGRSLLAALTLALITLFAFVALAGAEKVTYPPEPDETAESFAASCGASGGQLIEITGSFGLVTESSCSFKDGSVNSCHWYTNTCSSEWPGRPAPPVDPIGSVPSGGEVVDETLRPSLPSAPAPVVAPVGEATLDD